MCNYTIFAVLALFFLCSTACRAEAEIPKGLLLKSMEVEGKDIKYAVYVPAVYDGKKAMPAVIHLNGYGECGTDGLKQAYHFMTAVMLKSSNWPFIVIFPQKQEHNSMWEDEEALVLTALEQTKREYKIDSDRLYLTGLSQGGHGVWAIAARHPKLFAAIAPVCGWGDQSLAAKLTELPIWAFHGEADTTVLPERSIEMAKWINDAGGSCKLTLYPEVGHNSWDKAYRDENLNEWFLQHRRK